MTFKVLLHHYGMFTSPPGRKFVGGLIACVDPVEIETFSAEQLKKILTNSLGYDERSTTFFYIKKPNCCLDSGLVCLADVIDDHETVLAYTQVNQNKLHVYVSRVELSPLVVAAQCNHVGTKKNIQDKPSCSKKLFD